ncbi:hypothetical protein FOZ60_015491 [Perkinsus olseni]|uniref:Uncharacterized protein n=1 Tax=Perkinsus olseni TaxID=32597 RepID=A0A7J6N5M1_PEROL|nr:hypothetical protein FOZ60_015491 [Perkinsus olseni]
MVALQHLIVLLYLLPAAVLGLPDNAGGTLRKVGNGALHPIPPQCLNGAMDPVSLSEECIPPFLNHMLVNAATPRMREELRRLKLNVSEYTYFEVYSYSVDFSDKESDTALMVKRSGPDSVGGVFYFREVHDAVQDRSKWVCTLCPPESAQFHYTRIVGGDDDAEG